MIQLFHSAVARSRVAGGGGGPTGTAFFTGTPTGTPRGGSYWVGCKVTIGGSNIDVTALGCWVVSGQTFSNSVRIYQGTGSLLASVTVNATGEPTGYKGVNLGAPVTLTAAGTYEIIADKTADDHTWYDEQTIANTGVASVANSVYASDLSAFNINNANQVFVPVNFWYL